MKTIIAGSRDIIDEKVLFRALKKFNLDITEVVSGGAKGADSLGEVHANCLGLDLTIFPAKWDEHGRKAGPLRNIEMGDYADQLLALWDGQSRGTQHMIKYMKSLNKPTYVYDLSLDD